MKQYDRAVWWLAVALAVLAGYVDAIGFLKAGGLFVSFMSGNSTRLAVGVAAHMPVALVAGGLIGSFLIGVIAGAWIALAAGARRKPVVIVSVAAALSLAALGGGHGGTVFLLAAAMGMMNAVFQRGGEVSIGVTYMTGALVKFGQNLALALAGRREGRAYLPYLMLWSGLVGGAIAGATLYPVAAGPALWLAAGVAWLLALPAWRLGPVAA